MRRIALVALLTLWAAAAFAQPVKTSKERLSDKASDEQRVDNCGVPLDRRGPESRPDCAGKPAPATVQNDRTRTLPR